MAGGCEQGEWWEQSHGEDSGLYFKCGRESPEGAGKGQEIILFAVEGVNCREEWPQGSQLRGNGSGLLSSTRATLSSWQCSWPGRSIKLR